VTDANRDLVGELVEAGIERREARWLIEEFVPGGDLDALAALHVAAQRRLDGEPLQYVLGHWPFRSLDLDVDPRVLIPRPETEELVGVALLELATLETPNPLMLDLGCGSGAIGLALLSELKERGVLASLFSVDESEDALAVARRNALKHHLHAVTFVHSSWYSELDTALQGRVDLIVANPPYVGDEEFATLDPVLAHEPKSALVAPDANGVVGFEDLLIIISQAPQWLSTNGILICEHANTHADAVRDAAANAGFTTVDLRRDLAGHPRIMVARRS
jgi:release factor glutamine methyltransferase